MFKTITLISFIVAGAVQVATGQVQVIPGQNGPMVISQVPIPQNSMTVTPAQFTGPNPQTGAPNTFNYQIEGSAFTPGRSASFHNGSAVWQRERVYDPYGRVVGYQEGWKWQNSYTNQPHFQGQVYTPNQYGGVNQQYRAVTEIRNSSEPRPIPST